MTLAGRAGVRAPRIPLREHLKGLQTVLDEAAADHLAHRQEHQCRVGTCEVGAQLAARVAEAQGQLGMTRFLNED